MRTLKILSISFMIFFASMLSLIYMDYSSYSDISTNHCSNGLGDRNIIIDHNIHRIVGGSKSDIKLREKEFILTFDDGPNPFTTNRIIRTLAKNCIPANFFALGVSMRVFPWIASNIRNLGFRIGTHSFSHRDLPTIARSQAEWEVLAGFSAADAALKRSHPPHTRLFRFPRWKNNSEMLDFVNKQNGVSIFADISPEDWRGEDPAVSFARFKKELRKKDRGIIVLHDKQWNTAPLTQMIIDEVRRRGGTFALLTAPSV